MYKEYIYSSSESITYGHKIALKIHLNFQPINDILLFVGKKYIYLQMLRMKI